MDDKNEGVLEEVYEKLLQLQPRCIVCGSTYQLHAHHRIFKSEGESGIFYFLIHEIGVENLGGNKRRLNNWKLNDIQNLCVLCQECHEGKKGVHGGNEKLRQFLRNSYTCPVTGFNISYKPEII